MIKYEDIILLGCDDGWIKGLSLYPHQIYNLVQHEEDEDNTINKIDISHCNRFLASCSDDFCINFFDLSDICSKVKKYSN